MTVVDERTPGLGLALPHPDNKLQDDVLRVRQALTALDAACESLAGILATKVDGADMAVAIANLQTSITNLGTTVTFLIGSKVGVVNGLQGPAVTLKPVHLGLGPANGPSALVLQRDGTGRVSKVTATVDGKASVQTLGYDGQGRVDTVTTTYDGRTRTETYTYTPEGRVAGMAATEILE